MLMLILACICFVGSHFLISSSGLRPMLVAKLGEKAYAGLFSALAIGLVIWMVFAYNAAPFEPLWDGGFASHLTMAIMPLAIFFVVAGNSTRNPTSVMQPAPEPGRSAKGILAITRHPVMWGIALWALLHLLANGDLASVVFFGSFALLGLVGTLALDAKKRRVWGEARWAEFAGQSSNLPFAALFAGRAKASFAEIGWWRLALSALIFALFLWLHGPIIGMPLIAS